MDSTKLFVYINNVFVKPPPLGSAVRNEIYDFVFTCSLFFKLRSSFYYDSVIIVHFMRASRIVIILTTTFI